MTQLSLGFGVQPQARSTDPVTSYEAARQVQESGTAQAHRVRILSRVTYEQGQTAGEIGDKIGLDNVAVSRRMAELVKAGTVVVGPKRSCRVKGSSMQTYWLPATEQQALDVARCLVAGGRIVWERVGLKEHRHQLVDEHGELVEDALPRLVVLYLRDRVWLAHDNRWRNGAENGVLIASSTAMEEVSV
jgi:DNA-binding Lrp family transcriptional regulator